MAGFQLFQNGLHIRIQLSMQCWNGCILAQQVAETDKKGKPPAQEELSMIIDIRHFKACSDFVKRQLWTKQ